MSPERIRSRLERLRRWHYDETTESLHRVYVLPDLEAALSWASVVARIGRQVGRLPRIEITGTEVQVWLRPERRGVGEEELGLAERIDEVT